PRSIACGPAISLSLRGAVNLYPSTVAEPLPSSRISALPSLPCACSSYCLSEASLGASFMARRICSSAVCECPSIKRRRALAMSLSVGFSFGGSGLTGLTGLTASPVGLTATPVGLAVSPDGLRASPVGLTVSPEAASPDGLTASPEAASPDGLTASPEGLTVSPDGLASTGFGGGENGGR